MGRTKATAEVAARARSLFVVVAAAGLLASFAPSTSAAEATLTASVGRATPGDTITVTETGWSETSVVTICGNEARRGASDCDHVSGVGFPVSTTRIEARFMKVVAPPVPCPCVLRASTPGETLVKTTPIDLIGVSTAPLSDVQQVVSRPIAVSAVVVNKHSSIANLLRSGMGGRTRRLLVLTLTNRTDVTIREITVTAALGRSTQGGETLQAPDIEPLLPRQTRDYTMELSLGPPAFGAYKAFGTVYSSGQPVTFVVVTRTTPGLLYLLVLVLVLDLAVLAALRLRRRGVYGRESWRERKVNEA